MKFTQDWPTAPRGKDSRENGSATGWVEQEQNATHLIHVYEQLSILLLSPPPIVQETDESNFADICPQLHHQGGDERLSQISLAPFSAATSFLTFCSS